MSYKSYPECKPLYSTIQRLVQHLVIFIFFIVFVRIFVLSAREKSSSVGKDQERVLLFDDMKIAYRSKKKQTSSV